VPASTHRFLFAVDIPLQYQYFQNVSCFVNNRTGLTRINANSFGCDVDVNPVWTSINIEFFANKKDRSLLVASLSNYFEVFAPPLDVSVLSVNVLLNKHQNVISLRIGSGYRPKSTFCLIQTISSELNPVSSDAGHYTCTFTAVQIDMLVGDQVELMISNFVDGASRLYLDNVVTISIFSLIEVPLFYDDVVLQQPSTQMILGNLKPLVISTAKGSKYDDFDVLELSCSFISPD